MPSQGPLFGSSATTSGSNGGTIAWNNVSLILVDDGSVATCPLTPGQISVYAVATGFGFSIPANATIVGIQVDIKEADSIGFPGNIETNTVAITKAGVFFTKTPADNWPTTLAYVTYGSASDLWGTTWTPAQINAATFGAAQSAFCNISADTAQIDAIRITVTYTLPPQLMDWFVRTNQPPGIYKKQVRQAVYDRQTGAFVTTSPPPPMWLQPTNQPPARLAPRTVTFPTTFPGDPSQTVPAPLVDGFAQPTNQPPNLDLKRLQRLYPIVDPFIADQMIVFPDALQRETNQPQMRPRDNRWVWMPNYVNPGVPIAAPGAPSLDGWASPTNQPPNLAPKRWSWLLYAPFITDPTTPAAVEVITIDKWYSPPSQPRFDLKRQQWTYPYAFASDITTLGGLADGWQLPTNQPYRILPVPTRQGWWVIDTKVLTSGEFPGPDKWMQPTNQPPAIYRQHDSRPRWFPFYFDPTIAWALVFTGTKACFSGTIALVTVYSGGDQPCTSTDRILT